MALFSIESNHNLEQIGDLPFKLEKEIQELTEKNLKTIFGLDFVCSEFSLNNFRIDSLTFDKSSSSFVIIEYKRDKNFSVIDQVYAYLALMLNSIKLRLIMQVLKVQHSEMCRFVRHLL